MLVYLPICGFLDDTQRHFLLQRGGEDMYWKIVTPHEVAHQWWGQTVGFGSYRDQWMSEGFANTSASIFLQATEPKGDKFREFWKEQRGSSQRRTPWASGPSTSAPSPWASASVPRRPGGTFTRTSSIPRAPTSCT